MINRGSARERQAPKGNDSDREPVGQGETPAGTMRKIGRKVPADLNANGRIKLADAAARG